MPDLAEPGLSNPGLGNMPCSDGTIISTFATPAEIADCQAPILAAQGSRPAPCQPPVPNCGVMVRYVPNVFGTKYSHSFIDVNNLGLNQYIEVSPNLSTVVPTMKVNFSGMGVYNDSA
jgi:hypothetical protein